MIFSHVFLPYCWVCKTAFDHSTKEERHHTIPKAYGGVNSPQVSLCDSHHSALHNIGLRMYSKKPFTDLLTDNLDQNKKLLWLASVACNARLLTENDPNKVRVIILPLKKDTLDKLKRLKPVYSKASRERLIEIAINQLYDRHFG